MRVQGRLHTYAVRATVRETITCRSMGLPAVAGDWPLIAQGEQTFVSGSGSLLKLHIAGTSMCNASSAKRLEAIHEETVETVMTEASKHGNNGQVAAEVQISLTVNGEGRQLSLAPWTTLLDALREHLRLTGSKKGCDHGQCGACTVLLDGRRVLSCLTLAVMKDGASVTTIEGLAKDGKLHPLQQAFIDHDGFQCGYCTPGQICSAAGLIAEGKAKTPDEIRELMSGNICRCGAYPNIVAAIQQAMRQS
jgi:xanthine dehydrogenase YagT iron-sulfur-binding subunit